MDEVEKERMDMEREKQQQIEARRKASANFDAFDVDFGPSSSRRETFDVPSSKQLNLTRNVNDAKQNNKENINRGLFPLSDISEISISDDAVLKNKLKSRVENLTSTPVQRNTWKFFFLMWLNSWISYRLLNFYVLFAVFFI